MRAVHPQKPGIGIVTKCFVTMTSQYLRKFEIDLENEKEPISRCQQSDDSLLDALLSEQVKFRQLLKLAVPVGNRDVRNCCIRVVEVSLDQSYG